MADQDALVEHLEVPSTFWTYDYLHISEGTYKWADSRQSSDLNNILPLPQTVKARVLLLEGLKETTIDACCSKLGVPREFFIYHKSESVRVQTVNTTSSKHCLFAQWSRLVNQSARHWEIESRIRKRTPYSVDTLRDPFDLRLDHERYYRFPGVFRTYCPISQTPEGDWQHMAREKISLFWTHEDLGLFGKMNYPSHT